MLRLCQILAYFWAHLYVAAVKRWSVHRHSLWIIGLQAINVSPLNHTLASTVSQRENASSPLKLQPPIYYVYVYKSLRRPHIPEACKEKRERERQRRGSLERGRTGDWGLKWRCVKSGQSCCCCEPEETVFVKIRKELEGATWLFCVRESFAESSSNQWETVGKRKFGYEFWFCTTTFEPCRNTRVKGHIMGLFHFSKRHKTCFTVWPITEGSFIHDII